MFGTTSKESGSDPSAARMGRIRHKSSATEESNRVGRKTTAGGYGYMPFNPRDESTLPHIDSPRRANGRKPTSAAANATSKTTSQPVSARSTHKQNSDATIDADQPSYDWSPPRHRVWSVPVPRISVQPRNDVSEAGLMGRNDSVASMGMANRLPLLCQRCDSTLSYTSVRAHRRQEMTGLQRLNDDIEEFCATTSAHGLPRAAAAERKINRYLWAVVFSVCLVAFAVQAYMMVEKFRKNEKIVNVELKFENIPFPAVTVCNLNPYKRSLAANMDAVSSMLSVFNEAMGKNQPLQPMKRDKEQEKTRTKRDSTSFSQEKYALAVRGCQCVTDEQCLPLREDVPPGLAVDVCVCYRFGENIWPCYQRHRYHLTKCTQCSQLGVCQFPSTADSPYGLPCWCQDVSHSCLLEGKVPLEQQLHAYDNFYAIDKVLTRVEDGNEKGFHGTAAMTSSQLPLIDVDDSVEGSGTADWHESNEQLRHSITKKNQQTSYLHTGKEHIFLPDPIQQQNTPKQAHLFHGVPHPVQVQSVQHAVTAACKCLPSGCTNLSDRPPAPGDLVCVCLLDAHTTGVHSCLPTNRWYSTSCTQCTSAGYCSVPAVGAVEAQTSTPIWRVPCVCSRPHNYCVLAGRGSYRTQVLPLTAAAPEVWRAYEGRKKYAHHKRAKREALPSPLLAANGDDTTIERAQFEPALTRCYCDPKSVSVPDCRADTSGPPGVNDTTCVCIYNTATHDQSTDSLWPCYSRSSWSLRLCARCNRMGTCDYSGTDNDFYKAIAQNPHTEHDACLCTDYIKLCVKVDRPPLKQQKTSERMEKGGVGVAVGMPLGSGNETGDPVEEFFTADEIADNATAVVLAAESWLNESLTVIWNRTPPPPTTEEPKKQEAKQAMGFQGMTDTVAIVSKAKENLVFAVANMTETEKSAMSYTQEEFIKQCSFNGHECDMNVDFMQMIDPTFGNCYTFNFNKTENFTDRAGPTYGLRISLFVNVSEYLPTSEASGVRITVHPSNEQPFPDTIGFNAPTGSVSSFGIHLKQVRRLSKPFGDCVSDGKTDEYIYRDKSYTVEVSRVSPHRPYTLVDKPPNVNWFRSQFKDCWQHVYSVSYSAAKWPASFNQISECYGRKPKDCLEFYRNEAVLIEIYYEALNYESLGESEAYGWPNLMADFGGQLGLWMGVSVITVVEFVIFMWTILAAPCRWLCCSAAKSKGSAASNSASSLPINVPGHGAGLVADGVEVRANGRHKFSGAHGPTYPGGYAPLASAGSTAAVVGAGATPMILAQAPQNRKTSLGLGLAARYRAGSLRTGDRVGEVPMAPTAEQPPGQYGGYFMV